MLHRVAKNPTKTAKVAELVDTVEIRVETTMRHKERYQCLVRRKVVGKLPWARHPLAQHGVDVFVGPLKYPAPVKFHPEDSADVPPRPLYGSGMTCSAFVLVVLRQVEQVEQCCKITRDFNLQSWQSFCLYIGEAYVIAGRMMLRYSCTFCAGCRRLPCT
ncbi:hypothetical protein MRX96_043081 [Rhipicephalus microplus]